MSRPRWFFTTCQECGKPARSRVMWVGCGVWLHGDAGRHGHAVVPAEADELARRELDRSLLGAEPWCEDVELAEGGPL